jgi:geranylgeranylglycerol-phosphate geranylgeranyltransferase
MVKIAAYIKLIRPGNAAMAALGVCLGFWLSGAQRSLLSLALMAISALCATGFGNCVNDINDVESDKINHPARPLPSGAITVLQASIVAAGCGLAALVLSATVSPTYCVATAIPLILLSLYAARLKATPLAGNILVSALVAYPLLYGAFEAPRLAYLAVPAMLAFLLNLSREIVKDVQDELGDRAQRLATTAVLSVPFLRIVITFVNILYVACMFLPYALGHFGLVYLGICLAAVLPLHLWWTTGFFGKTWRADLGRI